VAKEKEYSELDQSVCLSTEGRSFVKIIKVLLTEGG